MMCYLLVGSYEYVDDPCRLDACRTADLKSIPSVLQPVSTPLNYTAWSSSLGFSSRCAISSVERQLLL